MAVEPKLSDQEIASLMEIPHPTKETGRVDLRDHEGIPRLSGRAR